MTVNRTSLSTTADNSDIFLIAQAGSAFTNFATLTTSGTFARPIHVAAGGVTVDNQGALVTHGDGSSGITVGDPYGARYDNVTIVNHGTITTTGGTFWDNRDGPLFASGIDLFGDHNKAVNYGTITNLAGDDAGMSSVGSYSTMINYGHIDSTIAGMILDQYSGTEAHSTLINYGDIKAHWDGSYGMIATIGDNVLRNYGTIEVEGVQSFGMALDGDRNQGENYGTITAAGEADRGVLLEGVGGSFANYGTIRTSGVDSIGARFSGEDEPGSDGGTITNYGKIVSAGLSVSGAFANDHFVNHGSLVGDTHMGSGDDIYVAGKGGSLSGTLTLGPGDDLIVFEKGGGQLTVTDFTAGASTDDVIDLSALGFHSFGDVLGHASQSGDDVVLKFGGKDEIVLQHVALGALSPDDFLLAAGAGHMLPPLGHHDAIGTM